MKNDEIIRLFLNLIDNFRRKEKILNLSAKNKMIYNTRSINRVRYMLFHHLIIIII